MPFTTPPYRTTDELRAKLDAEHPVPATHDGPSWPEQPGRHCELCTQRKTTMFGYLYSADLPPVPSVPRGRFAIVSPQPLAAL